MKLILPLSVVWLFIAGPIQAESGLTSIAFLQRILDARSTGMGGAATSIPGYLGTLQYNPAGTAALPRPTLFAAYMPGLADDQFGFMAYGQPLSHWGTLSAGVQYYNAGPLTLNLSNGTHGSVTAEEDYLAVLSYAFELLESFDMGASYKYVHSNLANTAQASTSLGDVGFIWKTWINGLHVGGALQNLGPNIRYESSGDPPPRTLRYGLSYQSVVFEGKELSQNIYSTKMDFVVAADDVEVLHESRSPRLGFELGIAPPMVERVALRLGWTFNRSADSFAFGTGLREGRYIFDYAFGPGGELASVHQFSVSILF